MAERAARAVLKIDDLQVYYGESHALQGVSLTLESGLLSVVGRNGMGKSTLCNTITGLKRARSGSIRVNGREISSLDPHEIHRLGVGYVPEDRQAQGLLRGRSIADNLLLFQNSNGGWPKNIDMARVLTDDDKAKLEADRDKSETIVLRTPANGEGRRSPIAS